MNQAVLLAHLKPETEKINILMREDLRIIDDALLREVLTHALFNGGKRVRPLLCSLAARICGSYSDSIFHLAIAFEYLHVATLLHDDVIDQAEKRRGQETVSRRWGSTPAILAGDFLHARSMFLIGSQGGIRCLEIICKATAAMVEGEFLQLHNASNLLLSENDYLRIIKGKTAVLIRRSDGRTAKSLVPVWHVPGIGLPGGG
jgi:octaprenyl-diphosphate synthase